MTGPVVLFPSSVEPVGVAVHVLELAWELYKRKIRVLVICIEKGWLDEELNRKGIPYRFITASPTITGFFRGNVSLFRAMFDIPQPAVLHLHGRMPLLCSMLSRFLLPRLNQVCTVHQFYDPATAGPANLKSKLETALLRTQTCVIVVSKSLREDVAIHMGIDRTRIVVAANFISYESRIKIRSNKANLSQLKLVGIGRLSPEKGFDIAIQAINLIRTFDCSLDIIGDGPHRSYLESLIVKLGLSDRVRLLGTVPNASRFISKYDAVLVPSRSESFGIVVLEAFRAGVTVIASSVRGLSDVATPDSAILVEPESPTELAEVFRALVSNPELRADFGEKGRRRFERVFIADHSMAILLSVYKKLIANTANYLP